MKQPVRPWVLLLAAMIPVAAGCTASSITNKMDKKLYQANLDTCNEVLLMHETVKHQENWNPEKCYERITVIVRPRPKREAEYSLKRKASDFWPSYSQFDFGEIEARTDESGQRIWFVDRGSGKIIGTVDRETDRTTGPDEEAPAWATKEGGRRLETPD